MVAQGGVANTVTSVASYDVFLGVNLLMFDTIAWINLLMFDTIAWIMKASCPCLVHNYHSWK